MILLYCIFPFPLFQKVVKAPSVHMSWEFPGGGIKSRACLSTWPEFSENGKGELGKERPVPQRGTGRSSKAEKRFCQTWKRTDWSVSALGRGGTLEKDSSVVYPGRVHPGKLNPSLQGSPPLQGFFRLPDCKGVEQRCYSCSYYRLKRNDLSLVFRYHLFFSNLCEPREAKRWPPKWLSSIILVEWGLSHSISFSKNNVILLIHSSLRSKIYAATTPGYYILINSHVDKQS